MPSERLLGVGVTTAEGELDMSELDAISQTLGVSIISDTDIAASVQAERYFGSCREATTLLYFDALHLQVGAMVGPTVLARRGTLNTLLGLADEAELQKEKRLPYVLEGAVALLQAEMLVMAGLRLEDFERFRSAFTVVPVLPACEAATNPAQAAATLSLIAALVP